jgi:Na+-driven multidrug efflux pump
VPPRHGLLRAAGCGGLDPAAARVVAETRSVGLLGTAPLAAMAIVFPFAMLVQMMSAGAMGGGVTSAVARALGAKDPARARTVALHAVVIGTVAGLATTVVFLVFGPAFYHALGVELHEVVTPEAQSADGWLAL